MLTPEQMQLRRQGVTASEVAAVVGLSPWRDPTSVFFDKINEHPAFTGNEQTWIGERLERAIADMVCERQGWTIVSPGNTVVHPDYPEVLATPDFYIHCPGVVCPAAQSLLDKAEVALLEIKNTGNSRPWNRDGDIYHPTSGSIPPYYWAQVQWQMFVTFLRRAFLGVLLGGRELRTYQVEYDEPSVQAMLQIVRAFWTYVKAKEVPSESFLDAHQTEIDCLWQSAGVKHACL